ncbi:leucine-rich repeat protein [bacterium]|nr:leucine-rich repeat protein [bacterium]
MQKKKKLIIGLSVLGSLAIATAVVSGAVCTSINQKQSSSDVSNFSQSPSINSTSTANASATTINNSVRGDNSTRRTPNGKIAVMNATTPTKVNTTPSALFPSQVAYSSFNYTFTTNVNGSSTSYTFSYLPTSSSTCTLLGFPMGSKDNPTNIVIPATVVNGNNFYAVTAIASGAFYGQNLTSVTFNQGLLTIGSLAFANNDLTSLTFPSSLTSIGNKAFISNPFPHAYAVHVPLNAT